MKRREFLTVSLTLIILLCGSCASVFRGQVSEQITGILGALDEEVAILQGQLADSKQQTIEGVSFVSGKLRGRKVVIAQTGIGKVNAAMTTTLMIEHFGPAEIIFTGIAGRVNPELSVGDIVIAEKTAHHDMGIITETGLVNRGEINPFDGVRNPVFFPADERLLKLAEEAAEKIKLTPVKTVAGKRAPRIVKGIVVTGDVFVASAAKVAELRRKLGADAVEMEGAAVAQVCYQRRKPCIVIRSISDKADEESLVDVDRFTMLAAVNSAALVAQMVEMSLKD